jgi:hypothetical protein
MRRAGLGLPELDNGRGFVKLAEQVYEVVELESKLLVAEMIATGCEPVNEPTRAGLDDDLGDAFALRRPSLLSLLHGGDEVADLLESDNGSVEIGLAKFEVVFVDHECRVVGRADVAEDATGRRVLAFAVNGDDDRGLMLGTCASVFSHDGAACLAW